MDFYRGKKCQRASPGNTTQERQRQEDSTSNGISKYHFKQLDPTKYSCYQAESYFQITYMAIKTLNMVTEGYFIFFFKNRFVEI